MKKYKPKTPASKKDDVPFSIEGLIEAIYRSALPQAKKLAYLSMLVEGSFTGTTFERLRQEMKNQGRELRLKVDAKAGELKKLDQEIEQLEKEVLRLTPEAMRETQGNLQQLVELALQQAQQENTNQL